MTQRITTPKFTPLADKVFVTDLEHGLSKTSGGIIRLDDNMKDHGIRERWAKVWRVGSDIEEVKAGDWVLIKHGRWSAAVELDIEDEGVVKIWQIDFPDAVLLVTDDNPVTDVKTTL